MDYEEKYKEAFERAKKLYGKYCINNVLESIFPELKESEDERISREITEFILTHRIDTPNDIEDTDSWLAWLEKQGDTSETINKDKFAQGVLKGAAINLITWIDYNAAEGNMCLSNMECKDIEDSLVNGDWNKIYAYIKKKLEKQGEQKVSYTTIVETGNGGINALVAREVPTNACDNEQKPTDKVEPKFKVGDWITNGEYTWFIEGMHNSFYDIISPEGCGTDDTIIHVDEHFHLWTLTDAKDGDVLHSPSHHLIWIYKDNNHYHASLNLNHANVVSFDNEIVVPSDVCPANRVQRSILFQKIEESNYKWDAEKKELKMVEKQGETSPVLSNSLNIGKENDGKISPKWTEEDSLMIDSIIDTMKWLEGKGTTDMKIDWLEQLKQRLGYQPMIPIVQKDVDDLVYNFKWCNESFKDKRVTDIYRQGIYDVVELLKQRML